MKIKKQTKKITKKMSFAEIMKSNPDAMGILLDKGMHCMGCPMAMQETLEDGAMAHGINPDEIVNEINNKKKK